MSQAISNDSPQRLRELEIKPDSVISTIREMNVSYKEIDEDFNKKTKYQSFYKPLGDIDKLLLKRLSSIPKTSGGNLESIISRRNMSLKHPNSSINKSRDFAPMMKQIFTTIENSMPENKIDPYKAMDVNDKQTSNLSSIELKGTSFKGRYMKCGINKKRRNQMNLNCKSKVFKESASLEQLEVNLKEKPQEVIHSSKVIGGEIPISSLYDQKEESSKSPKMYSNKESFEIKNDLKLQSQDEIFSHPNPMVDNELDTTQNNADSVIETKVKIVKKPKQTPTQNESDISINLVKLKLLGQGEFIEDMYKSMAKKQRLKSVLERKMQIEQARLLHKHNYLKKVRDMNNPNILFTKSKNTKEKNLSTEFLHNIK